MGKKPVNHCVPPCEKSKSGGAAPPAAEWGSMMSGARNLLQTAPWTVFVPGAAIFTTVALFQLFADSLRDLADAKTTR